MMPTSRAQLGGDLTDKLAKRAASVSGSNSDFARRFWRNASTERAGIRNALRGMASGIERCMSCCDSRGTDIDHFEPIALTPRRTFDWQNHLLACSSCNSNAKRDQFPVDEHGASLLVDPSAEDPFDHIRLTFATGSYEPVSSKGSVTIKIFQLNRPDLCWGRVRAFRESQLILKAYFDVIHSADADRAAYIAMMLRTQPFADVTYAMRRCSCLPGAPIVLGGAEI